MGLIGRAAAVFRVNEIVIYPDLPWTDQRADMSLAATLLAYMETPQYLRKKLFKIEPSLRYVGVLPPLRTPHHPLSQKAGELRVGEYRDGVILSKTKGGSLVDIGVERPALILGKRLPIGKRVTVRVTNVSERVEARLVKRDEVPDYWGYAVTVEGRPFAEMVKGRGFDLAIATSRYGVPFKGVADEIAEAWGASETVLVAFGSPTEGLYEIVEREGLNLDEVVDFVVNTIPMQGTETVRTEEALIATLAIFNVYFQRL